MRGTFANVRLKNDLVRPKEGGFTVHLPDGTPMTVYEAAGQVTGRNTFPSSSSPARATDKGARGTGPRRGPASSGWGRSSPRASSGSTGRTLIEMGVLPLSYSKGESFASLGLTGRELFDLLLPRTTELGPGASVEVRATDDTGAVRAFHVDVRLHNATEVDYYRAGGVLPYVMEHRFAR